MTPTRSIRHGSASTVLSPTVGVVVLTAGAAMLVPVLAMLLVEQPSLAVGLLGGLLVRPAVGVGRRLGRPLAGLLGELSGAAARARGRPGAHRE